jgi:hypothetical protein
MPKTLYLLEGIDWWANESVMSRALYISLDNMISDIGQKAYDHAKTEEPGRCYNISEVEIMDAGRPTDA